MFDMPPPDPGVEIVLATRGYSKGLAQTEGVQGIGRVELVFAAVAIGAQYKNISSPTAAGEASFSAGWKGKLGGFDLGASIAWKRLIGLEGQADPDSWELTPSIARRIGPLTAKLSMVYSPDDLGSTGESAWIEGGASWKAGKSTSFSANVGRRERSGSTDYTAFNAGVTRTLFKGITADLRYYDSARSALGETFEGRVVGALRAKL